MTLLFAYASNLNRERMAERCPSAEPVGTASLADHRLVFRHGADVEPHAGSVTPGVVWRLTPQDLVALDHYEGCPAVYRKDFRHVQLAGGQLAGGDTVECLIYRMNREGYAPPPEDYLAVIRDGYHDFGLPDAVLDSAVELSCRLKPGHGGPARRPGVH
ncbi:MAG: gamma-glutamylcyclotransferase family protein [Rhodospirillaceae bacterium]